MGLQQRFSFIAFKSLIYKGLKVQQYTATKNISIGLYQALIKLYMVQQQVSSKTGKSFNYLFPHMGLQQQLNSISLKGLIRKG
jgi:hypothetical protein